jgi:mRNA interferase HigB
MRIIKPGRVREFQALYPAATSSLEHWLQNALAGRWKHLVDVRKTFPHADEVKVASGRRVVIFNIKKNDFRLITAIHYNMGKIFVLMLMNHAEYDRDAWKDLL